MGHPIYAIGEWAFKEAARLEAMRRAELKLCRLSNRYAQRGDLWNMRRADDRLEALRRHLYQ
jgi:hypothetical protein